MWWNEDEYNQNMHNGWADFKENRTMKSFFWEGQFSSESLVTVGTHWESPRIPTLCLGLEPAS